MSNQGNNSASVVNPGIDQVIVATPQLFASQYTINFTASSDNGAGETAFQLLRGVNNVILMPFQEQVGGIVEWSFTGAVKVNDIFQVVSKTADARKILASITWLIRGGGTT